MENGQWATGNGQRATGNGQRATGNGQRATGNGQRESGNECTAVTCLIILIQNGGRGGRLNYEVGQRKPRKSRFTRVFKNLKVYALRGINAGGSISVSSRLKMSYRSRF